MNHVTKEELIGFENHIKDLWEAGDLPFLLHLCSGNEDQLIEIFKRILPGDWIFSGHRSHYHYLLAGGAPVALETKIRNGDSMFVFDNQRNFLTSSILGGTPCIAAGVARAIKEVGGSEKVWCFFGDGAEDNGAVYEAINYVQGHQLPCTFVIEDNDNSVDTNKIDRRGSDYQIQWPDCVIRYHYKSKWPHAGSACKHQIKFK